MNGEINAVAECGQCGDVKHLHTSLRLPHWTVCMECGAGSGLKVSKLPRGCIIIEKEQDEVSDRTNVGVDSVDDDSDCHQCPV